MNKEAAGMNIDQQGRILVWGAFDTYLGQARSRIVRLDADGAIDPTFNPVSINGGISDVAEQADGKLIIVGGFTEVDGASRSLVARLNANGSHDASFNPGSGLTKPAGGQNIALDVKLTPNGHILVGGTFTHANGLPRNGIALLTGGEEDSGSGFSQWAAESGLSGPDAEPTADPDHDGVVNQAEFIYGTSPTNATARPIFNLAETAVGGQSYPTVSFTLRIGANVQVQAATSIDFASLLTTVEVSVTPAPAPGFEQVTIRTTQPRASTPAQFFRMIAQ
jgi:uncharacterized delta-60 repeat protein